MRPIQKTLAPFALAAVAAACSGKGGTTEPAPLPSASVLVPLATSAAASPGGSALASPSPKRKRPKTREAPNPEKMSEYRKHLTAGRLLASKSQFPEAIKELDAALAAVPGDAPALVEKSFAAMKAGELDKAKKAGEEALTRTTSPKIRAMAHYNLGRVAEAQKDMKAAIAHYQKSVELRPNESVDKRLAELLKTGKPPAALEEVMPCQTPSAKIEDVCACFVKPEPGEEAPRTCEKVKDANLGRDDIVALDVTVPIMTTERWLVARNEKGWVPVKRLLTSYNPGAFGIYEEIGPITATERPAGKTKVLWIESSHERHDSDMGLDEYEEQSSKWVTVCVPPAGEKKAWSCPVSVPVETSYVRDRMQLEGFTPDEVTRDLMTKGLPIKEETKVEVKLLDGKIEVKLISGKPSKIEQGMLGTKTL